MFKDIKYFIRRSILFLLLPIAKWMATHGSINSDKDIEEEYLKLFSILQPGDIILTHSKSCLTNLLIPGEYKHAIMYIGNGMCVEAVYPKVRKRYLIDVLGRVDKWVCMRPTFATSSQIERATTVMEQLIGAPYDFYFELNNKSFYCSEAIRFSYKNAVPKWKFEPRERMGTPTVTPQDLHDCHQFKILITS